MEISPVTQARVTGFFWLICVVAGIYGYLVARGTHAGKDAILVGGAAYLIVTVLLYALLKPVNPSASAIAAGFGLVGIATSSDSSFYFGMQCIIIGCLVMASTFLPRTLGVLMIIAGISQLLFFSTLLPALASSKLATIGYIGDGIGEIALAVWLLAMGVNTARWQRTAAAIS